MSRTFWAFRPIRTREIRYAGPVRDLATVLVADKVLGLVPACLACRVRRHRFRQLPFVATDSGGWPHAGTPDLCRISGIDHLGRTCLDVPNLAVYQRLPFGGSLDSLSF